jgi:drug/metabolite transporter (DMT)-like permease
MGVVAPISGVVGASVPILVAGVTLGAPSWVQAAGFALALAAVWLLAGGSIRGAPLSTLVTPIVAGLGFGFFYVFMARVGGSGFFWPLATSRTAAGLALLGWGLLRRQQVTLPRSLLPAVAAVALFDTGGNLFYLLAAQTGRLDMAAVLSSLYPGMTVLLAWLFLHEQLSRPQWAGVAAAMLAIPLIVA